MFDTANAPQSWKSQIESPTPIPRKLNPLKVVSLFAGCGGMDLGFRGGFEFLGKRYPKNKFEILWANDFSLAACETYVRNVGKHIHHGDIWSEMANVPPSADIVIGGFPCQDISINGKGAGVDGKRSGLYRAMVEVVKRCRPKIFVAENVKGLLMRHNAESLERVLHDFEQLGYELSYQLYLAADYGVPQARERVIIVGRLPEVKSFVPPKATLNRAEYVTASAAVNDLENLPEDLQFNHVWSRANKSSEQGSRKLSADKPSQTIRAECHGNIQFHYKLNRRISMREAARFQSFPDDFLFQGGLRQTERQVGNAVPPVLAWHIARSVQKMLGH
jgi:DNA (cytosine-5)-methyltransferase 1